MILNFLDADHTDRTDFFVFFPTDSVLSVSSVS
jgi:hypothetical protein